MIQSFGLLKIPSIYEVVTIMSDQQLILLQSQYQNSKLIQAEYQDKLEKQQNHILRLNDNLQLQLEQNRTAAIKSEKRNDVDMETIQRLQSEPPIFDTCLKALFPTWYRHVKIMIECAEDLETNDDFKTELKERIDTIRMLQGSVSLSDEDHERDMHFQRHFYRLIKLNWISMRTNNIKRRKFTPLPTPSEYEKQVKKDKKDIKKRQGVKRKAASKKTHVQPNIFNLQTRSPISLVNSMYSI
jgi:hypothetical protein